MAIIRIHEIFVFLDVENGSAYTTDDFGSLVELDLSMLVCHFNDQFTSVTAAREYWNPDYRPEPMPDLLH